MFMPILDASDACIPPQPSPDAAPADSASSSSEQPPPLHGHAMARVGSAIFMYGGVTHTADGKEVRYRGGTGLLFLVFGFSLLGALFPNLPCFACHRRLSRTEYQTANMCCTISYLFAYWVVCVRACAFPVRCVRATRGCSAPTRARGGAFSRRAPRTLTFRRPCACEAITPYLHDPCHQTNSSLHIHHRFVLLIQYH
jgi:hypothetical protein